ncbi:MAG: serine hydrolase domain-containing protein [Thermomicrobiales bacterium]
MTSRNSLFEAVPDQAVAEGAIVGADVVVMHHGEIVAHHQAGFADREAGIPVNPATKFRLDSATKAFTSVAAIRLIEQKIIHPDDLVSTWLPEFQPRLPSGNTAEIRLHHLMTHTAGFGLRAMEGGSGPYSRAGVSDGMDLSGIGMEENLQRISSVPLEFEPGTQWMYSLATDVLGEVVGRAYGSSLREAIRDLITVPLELRTVGFDVPEDDAESLAAQYTDGEPAAQRMPDHVVPAAGEGGPIRSLRRCFDLTAYPSGGAGIVGSALDVAIFLDAVRRLDLRIVSGDSADYLFANQIGSLECDAGWGYTYGWSVLVDPSKDSTPQSAGTISWAGGLGHRWFVDPANHLTVVSLTNTCYAGTFGPYPDSIRDAAYRLIAD